MRALKKHGFAANTALKTPRFQPDYNDEVSEEFLDRMRQKIEEGKPKEFHLSPVCEPGW